MLTPMLNLTASAFYLSAGGLLAKDLYHPDKPKPRRLYIFGLSAVAIILHAVSLFSTISPQMTLGFTTATSLIAWVIATLFVVTALARPIENLGVLVLPAAAIAMLAAWLWPSDPRTGAENTLLFEVHLVISLLAYAFFALAMVQAVLLTVQENRLHKHQPGRLLQALPPIETMEKLLFQLISVGFILLSLTLVNGALFAKEVFGNHFVLNHHTVLALAGWAIFATLLIGRWRFGWRGRIAARWTIGGFVVLALGYLGTKFVLEIILQR